MLEGLLPSVIWCARHRLQLKPGKPRRIYRGLTVKVVPGVGWWGGTQVGVGPLAVVKRYTRVLHTLITTTCYTSDHIQWYIIYITVSCIVYSTSKYKRQTQTRDV